MHIQRTEDVPNVKTVEPAARTLLQVRQNDILTTGEMHDYIGRHFETRPDTVSAIKPFVMEHSSPAYYLGQLPPS